VNESCCTERNRKGKGNNTHLTEMLVTTDMEMKMCCGSPSSSHASSVDRFIAMKSCVMTYAFRPPIYSSESRAVVLIFLLFLFTVGSYFFLFSHYDRKQEIDNIDSRTFMKFANIDR